MADNNVSQDQQQKLIKQIDFYFSDSNYPRDKFLRAQAALDEQGYVPLDKIVTFERIKAIGVTDVATIAKILKQSTVVEVNGDGTKVKRIKPLPEEDKSNSRTIYTKGWSLTATIDEIEKAMQGHGKVLCVRIRKGPKKAQKDSAFIEFSTEDEAKKLADAQTVNVNGTDIKVLSKEQYFKGKKEEKKKRKSEDDGNSGEPEKKKAKVEAKEESKDDNNNNNKKGKRKQDRTYEKGLILQLKGIGENVTRETMKEALAKYGNVPYVDFTKGATEGYVRMEKAEDAIKVNKGIPEDKLELGGKVPECKLLEGDEEKDYWDKVFEMQNSRKKGGKKKMNKRKRF